MPGPQDNILQHLFQPEAGPEGGTYQKVPIVTFSGKQEIYNITKNQLSRHYGVLSRAQKPIFRPLFGVPWGPIMTYPKFDPTIL